MTSPERYVKLARGALVSLTLIVISGGAVRLTGSGLGCTDWPNCEEDQFVASLEYHALIEFVNRLVTGVVALAVIVAVLGSLRRLPRRADLIRLSWGLVMGVVAQILLGAALVKTDLDPRFTMGHFLLSMVLLWNATVLHQRAQLPDDPPDPVFLSRDLWSRHERLRRINRVVIIWGAALLVTGTIVTGSGPHSGSDEPEVAGRLPFLVRDVTRVHSLVAIGFLVLVMEATRRAHLADRIDVREVGIRLVALLVAQGTVGYWQYFTHVPVVLVGIHITLASLAWIQIVRFAWLANNGPIDSPAGAL